MNMAYLNIQKMVIHWNPYCWQYWIKEQLVLTALVGNNDLLQAFMITLIHALDQDQYYFYSALNRVYISK